VTAGDRKALLAIAGLTALAVMPFATSGFPFGHDAAAHAIRVRHLSAQLFAGEWYPRWMPGMNAGLGSPDFFVYGPVPFYISALFAPFADPVQVLAWSTGLALLLSGVFVYGWLRSFAPPAAALGGAAVYLLSPYHLSIDVYVRSAFAETWAFVWMPLVLLFLERLMEGRRRSVAGVVVGYALLIATHLPTAVLFSPVPLAYVVVRTRAGRTALRTTGAMLWGVGLAAIYLLPALAHEKNIATSGLAKDPAFHWSQHFIDFQVNLFGSPPEALSFSWSLTWTLLLLVSLAVFSMRRRSLFWLGVVLAAAIFMSPLSGPLWQASKVIRGVQFPYRALTIVTLAVAALAAIVLADGGRFRRLLMWPAMAGVCVPAFIVAWQHDPKLPWWDEPLLRISYDVVTRVWSRAVPDPASIERLSSLPEASFVRGEGAAAVERREPRAVTLRISSSYGGTVRVRQLYYPDWESDAGRVYAGADGLVLMDVPAGDSRAVLRLPWSGAERAGGWISALSFAGLLLSFALPSAGIAPTRSGAATQSGALREA
jgi:uncharacterized membrane protein